MAETAFWISVFSFSAMIGVIIFIVRMLANYDKYLRKISRQKIRVEKTSIEKTLKEMLQWHSLFVRLVFEALRNVESRLDEKFWDDLKNRYPDLQIFTPEKSDPEDDIHIDSSEPTRPEK